MTAVSTICAKSGMTVVDTNLKDTVCDIGEVILDGQLEDGVLKELPIVGWFFRAAKSVLTLQDRLFLRKISKFLSSLDDIPLCQGSCPSLYFRLYFSGGRDRPMTWHTQKNAGQRS